MMTKKDRNKMAMFLTVLLWLKEKLDELIGLPDFAEVLAQFEAYTEEIAKLDSEKVPNTKGLSKDKKLARKHLAQLTLKMVVILKAYAIRIKDLILLNSVEFTKSQLYYTSDQVLQSRAMHISTVAKNVGDIDPGYGLSEEKKTALTAAEKAFAERVPAPRKGNVTNQDVGSHLRNKFDETDNYLKEEVDSLLELAGNEKPELYHQYKAARVIVNR